MATNTFSRSADGLLRDTPAGYRKIDGSIYNAPIQGGGYYSGPEAGAPQLDMSTVQSAGGSSPMLPSGDQPVTGDPMDSFNKLSLGLLNSAKGLTTADLLQKRRLLERASIDRSSAVTPQDEQVLSPGQQSAIRGGRADALSSEIDQNKYEIEKAQQSIDNFFSVFEQATKISKDFADKMQAPDSVIENAQKVIYADPEKLSTILAGFNDKSKQAILGSLDYSKMGKKEESSAASGTITEVGGRKLLINPKTGETIKDLGSATGTVVDENQKYELQKGLKSADDVIKDLEKGESGALAGAFGAVEQFKPEWSLTGDTAYLFNKLTQLRQSIVLALRAKLKGQGTITDQETAMLEKASTALSRNIDIEDVKTEVEEMKNFLQFQLSGASGGNNDPLGIR